MYDTLHFWLPAQAINENSFTERVPELINNTTLHTKADGVEYITGSILGMSASVSNSGISLKGSLCKSYLNDNFKTLTRQDTQRAIEMLADTLHLPILQADVKRIDFAQSFTMIGNPESGNRAALLPPSPLRTVRATFTAYGSSSLNAN